MTSPDKRSFIILFISTKLNVLFWLLFLSFIQHKQKKHLDIPDGDAWTLTTALLIALSTSFLFPLTGSVPGPILSK